MFFPNLIHLALDWNTKNYINLYKHHLLLYPYCTLSKLLVGAVHMSRASPANRADLSHENRYFSTT